MRIQYKILLFMLCLNLASYLVFALALPGSSYVSHAESSGVTPRSVETQFDPHQIAEGWSAQPTFLIGDVVSAFMFFVRNFMLLIDGFPSLLNWISYTFITDASGQAAFAVIALTLRAVFAFLACTMLIEFIGGRIMSD